VKLKVASAALRQETVKVHKTLLRAKQQGEKIRLEDQEDSKRIMKEAKAMAEAQERRDLEDAEREFQEVQESTERALENKKSELELAKIEVDAWEDENEEMPTHSWQKRRDCREYIDTSFEVSAVTCHLEAIL